MCYGKLDRERCDVVATKCNERNYLLVSICDCGTMGLSELRTTGANQMSQEYRDGWKAYCGQRGISANPYYVRGQKSVQSSRWAAGWFAAREDGISALEAQTDELILRNW